MCGQILISNSNHSISTLFNPFSIHSDKTLSTKSLPTAKSIGQIAKTLPAFLPCKVLNDDTFSHL
jgi:hypothetical protein